MAQTDDSPCVHVCLMDYAAGHCTGCFRTLDEIASWTTCTSDRKREILATLETRRATAQTPD